MHASLTRIALAVAIGSSVAFAAELPRTAGYDYDPPKPGSYQLPVIKAAADGSLLDSNGKRTSLKELTSGRITVLSFIYTRCSDAGACPYASIVLDQLHHVSVDDPVLARNMRLVSMSFDPEHDTPKTLADYASNVRESKGGCEWRFVTPQIAELPSILSAYGQALNERRAGEGGGPLKHTLRVYLIDRQQRIRNIYSTGTLDPRLVLADVRTLLMEESASVAAPDER
jgi:protein SCO1